jgi:hypothetical protein
VIVRVINLCVLDVDVIRDKFYQQQPHPKVTIRHRESYSKSDSKRMIDREGERKRKRQRERDYSTIIFKIAQWLEQLYL